MNKKITLSSNIPITLPEKLGHFGLGFLYNCDKGFKLNEGSDTWFEKVCVSLNKFNALIGFQSTNLKIPEYIADTISSVEEQLKNQLTIRYNAQTKVNDLINSISPESKKESFNDNVAKSLTKGQPMIIVGEKTLKDMFQTFEEVFGLEKKVKFILHHEIAHNIDGEMKHYREGYSIKTIFENHFSATTNKSDSPFSSTVELLQTRKMITQLWKLSLEHYADVYGFLNMRNELLKKGTTVDTLNSMLDGLISERRNNLEKDVNNYFNKLKNSSSMLVDFEDQYKCINHFTVLGLKELKKELKNLDDKILTNEEIQSLTLKIVNKADLKATYVIGGLDNKTGELLEKVLSSDVKNRTVEFCPNNKKEEFINQLKTQVGENWLTETDTFIRNNKEKEGFYRNIDKVFTSTEEELKNNNKNQIIKVMKDVRNSLEVKDIIYKNKI